MSLRDLRRARQAGRDLVPVGEARRGLRLHELGRPRARSDEADVAAKHVQELRHLVHVPRLEHSAADPGEVLRVCLVRPGMSGRVLERLGSERPELEQPESASLRDAWLAVEEAAPIAGAEKHVQAERNDHEQHDGYE